MSFILGITGGIGSGKSAATQWFESQGITIIDADIVAREVVEPKQPALEEIQRTFGDWVLLEDGSLNRRALRDHIFQFPEARQALEKITHPAIRQSITQQLKQAESPYVILVSPLLFETNQHELTHHTLLIDAEEQTQLQRASQRDGQTEQQIRSIIAAQMPRAQKLQLANDVVLNDGLLEHLHQQLKPLHLKYLQKSEHVF